MLRRQSLRVLNNQTNLQPDERSRMTARIKERAMALGFDVVGIAAATPFAEARMALLERISSGYLSGLKWFTPERAAFSSDPANLLADVRSIISVAMSYAGEVAAPTAHPGRPCGRVARYAWGRDYHEVLKERMNALAQAIEEECAASGLFEDQGADGDHCKYRTLVDTARIIDRAVAARAGVGWYGKSTNIITIGSAGSWIFLGEVLTTLDLQPDVPLRKNCGSCDLCLRACPTQAIVRPYVLDSNRCISYLTIEHRGAIPRDLRPLMGDWVFGCDICQEVCPPNARPIAAPTEHAEFQVADPSIAYPDLVDLLYITPEEFSTRFRHSPIKRAKRDGLRRNAAVAIGNSGDRAAVPALVAALDDDSALLRTHVAWALGRLGGTEARQVLTERLEREEDDEVREEIELALQNIK